MKLPRRLACVAALAALGAAEWRTRLPAPLFGKPYASMLVDRQGGLLGAIIAPDEQWRFPRTSEVPRKVKLALVRYEDKRFYSHPGVDPLAVARAVRLNLSRRAIVSGASTISMQVIRLSRGGRNRTVWEKVIEVALALRLEMSYSKEQILSLYAEHAPFGGNTVGIDAASWRYFGRNPEILSWAESCTLAVLPNSPSLIHPGRNRALLKARRDRLLGGLYRSGLMDERELQLALAEVLPDHPDPLPKLAPHLLQTLRISVGHGGRFESRLDAATQRDVQAIVRHHTDILRLQGISNAAALVVDNRTFDVRAYVGNSSIDNLDRSGVSVDVVRSPRSSGSILKPLLYAAMLQAGDVLPTTLVPDVPVRYHGYEPANYDRAYRGAVEAREALARSLNVPAVAMLRDYGVGRFQDLLTAMGLTTLHRTPAEYGLSLILGGAESTLWDLAQAYANLANLARGENKIRPSRYHRLRLLAEDPGETFASSEIGPGAAWLTMQALLEVNRPGAEAFWRNFSSSPLIGWKTGTSYGHRDAWAVGSDARHTVAVWVGNADGEGRPDLTGISAAAPLLFDIFNRLGPGGWFEKPTWDLKVVKACRDDGYLPHAGCQTEDQLAPAGSNFGKVSPHHLVVHLDNNERWRVHGGCEAIANMTHRGWFVLPPLQEHYFRRHHLDYRVLPPIRKDCESPASRPGEPSSIAIIYPKNGTQLLIPTDLGGKRGRTVLEAAHRRSDARLFWHLDGQYVGATQAFHQQALDLRPGQHVLTIVDDEGYPASRRFTVLARQSGAQEGIERSTP